jgi:hypothetical protein
LNIYLPVTATLSRDTEICTTKVENNPPPIWDFLFGPSQMLFGRDHTYAIKATRKSWDLDVQSCQRIRIALDLETGQFAIHQSNVNPSGWPQYLELLEKFS